MKTTDVLETINDAEGNLFLLNCGEVILWDRANLTAYSSVSTHHNALMNPMIDLRTHLGHALLWSSQKEVSESSREIVCLLEEKYNFNEVLSNRNYTVYALSPKNKS